jgi:NADPH:quinone reductase-like Zn-dependent oxidoreductase
MKAIRIHQPGGPEDLVYEDAPIPKLQIGDALVRVCAMAITPAELTWDETYKTREGVSRLPSIPGHDVAVEQAAVHTADLAPKPRTLDFERAAAVPLSCLTAWQALFDHVGLAPGQRLLIHGASGGVGSYAVQLARWRGAHVMPRHHQPTSISRRDLEPTRLSTIHAAGSRPEFGRSTLCSIQSAGTH